MSRLGSQETALRQSLIDACLSMNALGINQGTSGNASARWADGLLITPSGLPYEEMTADDVVFLGLDGSVRGSREPSSEWRFHRDILAARPEVGAVVHTHSVHATALAICHRDLPAVHYMIGFAGGPTIRCAPYATFGTQALSDHAVRALSRGTSSTASPTTAAVIASSSTASAAAMPQFSVAVVYSVMKVLTIWSPVPPTSAGVM